MMNKALTKEQAAKARVRSRPRGYTVEHPDLGMLTAAFPLRSEAVAALARIREAAVDKAPKTWKNDAGYEEGRCVACGTLCNTHPDASSPLDFCGDCAGVTCPDHRDHVHHQEAK